MILINVLPPEYRRRDTGVSPVFLALVAAVLVNLSAGALWYYVSQVRIPAAENILADRQQELAEVQVTANKVRKKKQELAEFEKRSNLLNQLFAQKVYWGHCLDDFADLFTRKTGEQTGYDVSVGNLNISPQIDRTSRRQQRNEEQSAIAHTLRLTLKLVGEVPDQAGTYQRNMFRMVDASEFWNEHTFLNKSDFSYKGDRPQVNEVAGKVIITLPLEWIRVSTPETGDDEADKKKG